MQPGGSWGAVKHPEQVRGLDDSRVEVSNVHGAVQNAWALVEVPLALGLLGFIEPCTVRSSLLFVKHIEGKEATAKLLEIG